MRDSEEQSNPSEELIEDRQNIYGDAWCETAHVANFLKWRKYAIHRTPFTYAWLSILSKLIRALSSPMKVDHWDDIAGYAMLVARKIRSSDEYIDASSE